MKKMLLAAVAAIAFTGSASAQTTVDIPLSGELAKACTISAFLNGPFDALDLTSTATQGAESLTTNCNYPGGSNSVTLSSANNGELKSSGGQSVPYVFSISGGVLAETALTGPVTFNYGSGAPAGTNYTRSMNVRLTAPATIAGVYTDTVTATVTPN